MLNRPYYRWIKITILLLVFIASVCALSSGDQLWVMIGTLSMGISCVFIIPFLQLTYQDFKERALTFAYSDPHDDTSPAQTGKLRCLVKTLITTMSVLKPIVIGLFVIIGVGILLLPIAFIALCFSS